MLKNITGLVMKAKEMEKLMEANKNGGYLDKIKMIREKQNLLDPNPN